MTQYRYRPLNEHLQQQPLQLLYPGRYLTQDDMFTGENIEPEDPEGLLKTRLINDINTEFAHKQENEMAKILGGKDQILTHPAVEPEAMIEDPSLRGVSLETPVAVDMAQTSNPKSNVYSGAPIDIENYKNTKIGRASCRERV